MSDKIIKGLSEISLNLFQVQKVGVHRTLGDPTTEGLGVDRVEGTYPVTSSHS